MLFMCVHTHPVERCLAHKPAELDTMGAEIRRLAQETGVKILKVYWAPTEHTLFALIEGDDPAEALVAAGLATAVPCA